MLLSFPVAPSLGYSSYYANVGDMRNSGVEIELNFTPIRREHIQWDINLNMTHLRNKITMLPPERRTKQVDGYSGYVNGSTFFGEGLPMYTFYMRKYAGVSDEGLSMWYMDETDDKGNLTGMHHFEILLLAGNDLQIGLTTYDFSPNSVSFIPSG